MEERKQPPGVPQCCPYCSDSKYPCVKMERAIKRAVAEQLEKGPDADENGEKESAE